MVDMVKEALLLLKEAVNVDDRVLIFFSIKSGDCCQKTHILFSSETVIHKGISLVE